MPSIATGLGALAAAAAFTAAAHAETTDLVMHCDPPLERPLRALAAAYLARTGVRLRIFPTVPNGIPAQLSHEIQNDIVMTQPAQLARIGASGQLSDLPPSARWRDRLLIAARTGAVPRSIEDATLAAPDPGWGGGPDGPAILAEAGIKPARIIGTYDTAEAAALLAAGQVALALLHATELTSGLEIVPSPLRAERIAVAAVTTASARPNPEALLRFMATPEAAAILTGAGLERVA